MNTEKAVGASGGFFGVTLAEATDHQPKQIENPHQRL